VSVCAPPARPASCRSRQGRADLSGGRSLAQLRFLGDPMYRKLLSNDPQSRQTRRSITLCAACWTPWRAIGSSTPCSTTPRSLPHVHAGRPVASRPPGRPKTDACFIVRDAHGQALAYVYFDEEPGRRAAASALPPPRRFRAC
jgi:hypothetical protein